MPKQYVSDEGAFSSTARFQINSNFDELYKLIAEGGGGGGGGGGGAIATNEINSIPPGPLTITCLDPNDDLKLIGGYSVAIQALAGSISLNAAQGIELTAGEAIFFASAQDLDLQSGADLSIVADSGDIELRAINFDIAAQDTLDLFTQGAASFGAANEVVINSSVGDVRVPNLPSTDPGGGDDRLYLAGGVVMMSGAAAGVLALPTGVISLPLANLPTSDPGIPGRLWRGPLGALRVSF